MENVPNKAATWSPAAVARNQFPIIPARANSTTATPPPIKPPLSPSTRKWRRNCPAMKAFFAPMKCRTPTMGPLAAIAPRVANVTESTVASSASLDDHRGWIDRMRAMANTAIAGGLGILALVLAATVLSVTFATRGAMAANGPIVGVLHLIGAKNAFIAGQFRRHFLVLGLKGGLIGGGVAVVLFALAGMIGNWFLATAAGDQVAALFGTFSIGIGGYAAVLGQIVLIAIVTAETSRQVVNHTLDSVD